MSLITGKIRSCPFARWQWPIWRCGCEISIFQHPMPRPPGNVSCRFFSFPAPSRITGISFRSNCVRSMIVRSIAIWRSCVNASIRRFPAYPMGDSSPLSCDQLVAFFLRRGEPKYRETLIMTLEKQHDFLNRLLRDPGALNHANAPLADAGYFNEASTGLLNDRERV